MNDLYWHAPWWLLLVLYPLLLALLQRHMRRLTLRQYADPQLHRWVIRNGGAVADNRWKRILMALFWVALAITLAGPKTPLVIPAVAQPPRGTMLVVVDLSRSMDVGDMGLSRKGAALSNIKSWLDAANLPKIGLILFAGDAHLYLPPSVDRATLERFLAQLPDIVLPTRGNRLDGALDMAARLFQDQPQPHALVVLSDGDLGERAQVAAVAPLTRLDAAGVEITLLGFGGLKPVPVPSGAGGWLADGERQVLSARDERWFRQSATSPGTTYRLATVGETLPITLVWSHAAPKIARDKFHLVQWQQWYRWPLAVAMLLLLLALYEGEFHNRIVRTKMSRHRMGGVAVLLLLISLVMFGTSNSVSAATPDEAAYEAYTRGDYKSALDHYRQLPGYEGRFGEGVSCYRLKKYTCALEAFADAAWHTNSDTQRARAAYNMGNSFFMQGNYRQAIILYEDVLAHGVVIQQATRNLAFARELDVAVQREMAAEVTRNAAQGANPKGLSDDNSAQAFDRQIGLRRKGPVQNPEAYSSINPEGRAALIRRGIAAARLIERGAEPSLNNNGWLAHPDAQQTMPASRLWKHLFEIELGIQTRLDSPLTRAGARPW